MFPKYAHNAKEISISIKIKVPQAYKDNGIYIWKKVWRTNGLYKEELKNEKGGNPNPRSRIPGALKQIKYRYVPAVKSKDYYKSLLSELYLTVSSSLESPLNDPIEEFSKVLKEYTRSIGEEASNRLKIKSELTMPDNLGDVFRALIFITKADGDDLNITLDYRGDGIQAMHIPIILKYIAEEDRNSRNRGSVKICSLWGFEEPENGIELLKTFDMADEFEDYLKEIQMFITTHSPAFYLKKANEFTATVYFASKSFNGEGTIFQTEENKRILGENMGLMPLIAPFVNDKVSEIEQITEIISKNTLTDINTILVEGKSDKKYIEMAIKLYSPKLQNLTDNAKLRVYVKDGSGGTSNMVYIAKAWIYAGNKNRLYVLFDKDMAGVKAKSNLENSMEFKNKGDLAINCQYLEPSLEINKIRRNYGINMCYEIEHLLSIDFWKELNKRNYTTIRNCDEIAEMFKKYIDINKTIIEVVNETIADGDLASTIVMNNPHDDKKSNILKLAIKEFEEDKNTKIFEGLKFTVEKLEKAFIKHND